MMMAYPYGIFESGSAEKPWLVKMRCSRLRWDNGILEWWNIGRMALRFHYQRQINFGIGKISNADQNQNQLYSI
jgi:hypothetical protein